MVTGGVRVPIRELAYSSGLISQSCWFIEFRKLVRLIAGGADEAELVRECVENNLFGMTQPYRAKRVYGYLRNRAAMLDERLTELFLQGNLEMQKQINLIAILRGDRLFFEFLFEVYREKMILGHEKLEDMDFNTFFRQKEAQSDAVAAWSDSTFKHLRSNYTTCMADAGLLRMVSRVRLLQRPIVDDALQRYMADVGERSVMKAILGVM